MWIKFLRDQVRPWGNFMKGQTHSLPAADVAKLDIDSYEQVDVDEKAMEKLGVSDRVKHLNGELAMLTSSIDAAVKRLDDLKARRRMVAGKVKAAEDEIKAIEAEAKAKAEAEARAGAEAEGEADTKDIAEDGKAESAPEPGGRKKTKGN
jgi:peptidoglycan hydrolase CwlO-like protein